MAGNRSKKTEDDQPTFEEALTKLEKIVGQLENGELPLAEALSQFEQGVHYSRFCHSLLNDMEQKMNFLLEERDGVLHVRPLDIER